MSTSIQQKCVADLDIDEDYVLTGVDFLTNNTSTAKFKTECLELSQKANLDSNLKLSVLDADNSTFRELVAEFNKVVKILQGKTALIMFCLLPFLSFGNSLETNDLNGVQFKNIPGKQYMYTRDQVKNWAYSKSEVYNKDETYPKTEVYNKDETYSKSEVYNTNETYPKTDVYNKDETYSKTNLYTKDEIDEMLAHFSPSGDSEKTYPMFIIPLNLTEDETFSTFELKASTNNFSAGSPMGKIVFWSLASTAFPSQEQNGSIWHDGMRLYIENIPTNLVQNADSRTYMRIKSSLTVGDEQVRNYIVIVDPNMCHEQTSTNWLANVNDELIWTYRRGSSGSNSPEVTTDGQEIWHPIQPVKWFKSLPHWADQEPIENN